LSMILSVFCKFSFGHVIVCLFSVSLWQKTDNNMAKGKLTKDRQYHGQKEAEKRQTISWPKGSWKKTDTICLLSVFFWPWYCLSFVSFHLSMILSVFSQFSFGHVIVCFCQFPFGDDIVCLLSVFLWACYCLSFVSFPLAMTKDRQYNGQRETEKTDNIIDKGNLTKDRH
jgi:hypothetical protein